MSLALARKPLSDRRSSLGEAALRFGSFASSKASARSSLVIVGVSLPQRSMPSVEVGDTSPCSLPTSRCERLLASRS